MDNEIRLDFSKYAGTYSVSEAENIISKMEIEIGKILIKHNDKFILVEKNCDIQNENLKGMDDLKRYERDLYRVEEFNNIVADYIIDNSGEG